MRMDWKDKVILISGGTSGIGLATARILLGKEAGVVINGRDVAKGRAALSHLQSLPGSCQFVPGDVSDERACCRIVQETLHHFGRLDGLVTSAGYYEEQLLENVTARDVESLFATNVYGTIYLCREALEPLKKNQGSIVMVSSDAGLQGNIGCSVYSATKGAVVSFCKSLALELAPHDVRVNCVCPGDVKTPLLSRQMEANPDETEESLRQQYPLYRLAEASEVGQVIVFLLSREASYMTATAVPVDGGLTSW